MFTNMVVTEHLRFDNLSHKAPTCFLAVDRRVSPGNVPSIHGTQTKDRNSGMNEAVS